MITRPIFLLIAIFFIISCSDDDGNVPLQQEPQLNITFIMDNSAPRLDNFGDPVTIPIGNSGQNPDFDVLGLHFIGLYPDKFTPFDGGVTVFSSPTTTQGGISAIDFDQELFLTETENSLSVPLKDLLPGTYEYFRSSIGYQKYTIQYNLGGGSSNPDWPDGISDDVDIEGTIASFLGYNTYIDDYTLKTETIDVNANKLQGYFGIESSGEIA